MVRILGVEAGGATRILSEFEVTQGAWATLSAEAPGEYCEIRVLIDATAALMELVRVDFTTGGAALADEPSIEAWPVGKDALLLASVPPRVLCFCEGAGIRFTLPPGAGRGPVTLRADVRIFRGTPVCFEALWAFHQNALKTARLKADRVVRKERQAHESAVKDTRYLSEIWAANWDLKVQLRYAKKLHKKLKTIIASALEWQKAPWHQRAFHHWRVPQLLKGAITSKARAKQEVGTLVTVILPVHGQPQHLPACLAAIQAQVHSAIEVLIIGDSCFGENREFAVEFAARDPRFRVIISEFKYQLAVNLWRLGLGTATGEYVWIASPESAAEPSFLSELVRILDEHPGLGYACSTAEHGEPGGTVRVLSPEDEIKRSLLACQTVYPSHQVVFRNFDGASAYLDETLRRHADWMFWIRLCRRGGAGVYPAALCRSLGGKQEAEKPDRVEGSIVLKHAARAAGLNPGESQRIFDAFRSQWEPVSCKQSPPPKFGALFIVTYGRSGSTLVQGLLNSYPGVLVRGENDNLFFWLFRALKSLRVAKSYNYDNPNAPEHPWFGCAELDEAAFLDTVRKIAKDALVGDRTGVTCFGFKEIRYPLIASEFLEFLDFLKLLFPEAAFVFNTRNLEYVTSSAWMTERPKEALIAELLEIERLFAEFQHCNPECSVSISYEEIVGRSSRLREFVEFLGLEYSSERIEAVLSRTHSSRTQRQAAGGQEGAL